MAVGGLARRDFLAAATAVAAAAATSAKAAGHDSGGHGHHDPHPGGGNEALAQAAADCVSSGDACIAHCLSEFKSGRTELAECALRVTELTAACTTLQKYAAMGSSHLPAFAAATAAVCKSCESACREHAGDHSSCDACAKACAACIRACDKVTAA